MIIVIEYFIILNVVSCGNNYIYVTGVTLKKMLREASIAISYDCSGKTRSFSSGNPARVFSKM